MSIPEILPIERRVIQAFDIVMGAAASRDWQPQHHDHQHALAMNLPGIIMNTTTQVGMLHGYALRWAEASARIRKWKITMKQPICAGDAIEMRGQVRERMTNADGEEMLLIALEISKNDIAATTAQIWMQCI